MDLLIVSAQFYYPMCPTSKAQHSTHLRSNQQDTMRIVFGNIIVDRKPISLRQFNSSHELHRNRNIVIWASVLNIQVSKLKRLPQLVC